MTPRKLIGWGLLALLVFGIGNFAVSNLQTRGSLAKIAEGGASATQGARELMARGVLFDALQGGAPPKTRLNALAALATLAQGGKNPDAFKQLLQMLKDPDTETTQEKTHPVRDAALADVSKLGAQYPGLIIDAAKDPDGAIHDNARTALTNIGAPLETQMAARLADPDLRAPLGTILSGIGAATVPLVTPYLAPAALDKLKAKPDDLAAAKLQLIEIMGKYKTADAAQAVLPFVSDPDPNVRRGVLTALANIADPVGQSALIAALNDSQTDASARAAAAATLGAFGTNEANDAMVAALSDYDIAVADAAAAGLARAAQTNEATATPAITRALASPDPAVRARTASAASGLSHTDLLARAITDPDPTVRAAAASALGSSLIRRAAQPSAALLTPAEVAPLVAALRDPDGTVAGAAQQTLVQIGAPAAPALVSLLAGGEDTTAYYASDTLSRIGKPAFDAVAPLARVGTPGARWAAVTLGEIGDGRAKPLLESLEKSPDSNTAGAATDALAKIGG